MNKEKLKILANNPIHIEGIYNYCDSWCERCSFTSRCLTYKLTEENFSDSESRDLNNQQFWTKLSEVLKLTFDLLDEYARENGIDLAEIQDDTKDRFENSEIQLNIDYVQKAKEYLNLVNNWFKNSELLFEDKKIDLTRQEELNLPNSSPLDDILNISDAVEIIRWYQHQIYIKLQRAADSKLNEENNDVNDYPRDSDGSAKVALIGIDRSIAAWVKLQKHLGEDEDNILDFLIHLTQLKKIVDTTFPNAQNFVRIGFDE